MFGITLSINKAKSGFIFFLNFSKQSCIKSCDKIINRIQQNVSKRQSHAIKYINKYGIKIRLEFSL